MATQHSGAKFKINASAYADAGFDAAASATLTLQLEASPALDVSTCVYSCFSRTSGASAPTFANAGVADPPTAAVDVTIGGGVHVYAIRCQTNGGEVVLKEDGTQDFSINTTYRLVVVRTTAAGMRKIIVGETMEYDTTEGWISAFNELVEAVETLTDLSATGGRWTIPDTFAGTSGPESLAVSVGSYVRTDISAYGGGDILTITLPASNAANTGRRICIAETANLPVGPGSGEIKVTTSGGQTIDSLTLPYALLGIRPRAVFVSTGVGWSLESPAG